MWLFSVTFGWEEADDTSAPGDTWQNVTVKKQQGIFHRKVEHVFTFLEEPVSCRSDCENFTWNVNTHTQTLLSDPAQGFKKFLICMIQRKERK